MVINIQQALAPAPDVLSTIPLIGLCYVAALAVVVLFVMGAKRASG